ncbi:Hypothetical_protein [Hexamita inflata]|uniref:Hypothetical_protein n=1 Tax=Hexamita inflata TaxID=28002 RepID=A0AA86UN13_9EUKA|nr:Hypothetical protein HINF_LOCUS1861 [Hexamita inflata]CAI9945178.1 Hypothetical protein HINF_LOCUS32823 [Hexamita inflata]
MAMTNEMKKHFTLCVNIQILLEYPFIWESTFLLHNYEYISFHVIIQFLKQHTSSEFSNSQFSKLIKSRPFDDYICLKTIHIPEAQPLSKSRNSNQEQEPKYSQNSFAVNVLTYDVTIQDIPLQTFEKKKHKPIQTQTSKQL